MEVLDSSEGAIEVQVSFHSHSLLNSQPFFFLFILLAEKRIKRMKLRDLLLLLHLRNLSAFTWVHLTVKRKEKRL